MICRIEQALEMKKHLSTFFSQEFEAHKKSLNMKRIELKAQ